MFNHEYKPYTNRILIEKKEYRKKEITERYDNGYMNNKIENLEYLIFNMSKEIVQIS